HAAFGEGLDAELVLVVLQPLAGGIETLLLVSDGRQVEAVGRLDIEHGEQPPGGQDRKSTRLNSSHGSISYAVFCLKKKSKRIQGNPAPMRHSAAAEMIGLCRVQHVLSQFAGCCTTALQRTRRDAYCTARRLSVSRL